MRPPPTTRRRWHHRLRPSSSSSFISFPYFLVILLLLSSSSGTTATATAVTAKEETVTGGGGDGGALLSLEDQLPGCAVACLSEKVSVRCHDGLADTECVCGAAAAGDDDDDESFFFDAVKDCARADCSPIVSMDFINTYQEVCQIPKRSRRPTMLGFIVVEVFAISCIIMRLYVRYRLMNGFGLDDIVIGLVLFIYLFFLGVSLHMRIVAVGFDTWNLTPWKVTNALMLFWIQKLLYIAVLALCRLSVLFFVKRIFVGKVFQRICRVVMTGVCVAAVIFLVLLLVQCRPLSHVWEGWKELPGSSPTAAATCLNVTVGAYASSTVGILQDLAILVIPLPMIAKLQVALKRKLQVALMFSLGIFATITSCLRLITLLKVANSPNPTWDIADAVIWSSAEVSVSIICICLPSMRVLFARAMPCIFGSTDAVSWNDNNNHYDPHSGGGGGGGPGAPQRLGSGSTTALNRSSSSGNNNKVATTIATTTHSSSSKDRKVQSQLEFELGNLQSDNESSRSSNVDLSSLSSSSSSSSSPPLNDGLDIRNQGIGVSSPR